MIVLEFYGKIKAAEFFIRFIPIPDCLLFSPASGVGEWELSALTKLKELEMNEQLKKAAAYILLCGVIAVLSCPAAEVCVGILRGVITFIGDLAVLSMFSLYFPPAASELSESRPERIKKRRAIFCAADCVSLALKITFAALCAISGGVIIHAAALIVDCVFSRVLFLGECASQSSFL